MSIPDQTKVSRDLAEILDLEAALLSQAIALAGAQIDGRSLPGGHAMVSLAPVAAIAKWTDQVITAEQRWLEQNPGVPITDRPEWGADEDDSWEPALQTLRFWSDHYRRVLRMQYDMIPTLATEARFLRHESVLSWIFAREPHLKEFANDVNRARRRLENVVHAGRRAERTRVVCNHCQRDAEMKERPRLIKVYAARRPSGSGWISDPADDAWKCPACKHRYDGDALKRAHAEQLRHESAERYVPLDEARATLISQSRSDRTIRKWMSPQVEQIDVCTVCRSHWPADEHAACPRRLKRKGEYTGEVCGGALRRGVFVGDREAVVTAYCDLATHRVMVWWPDLWRLHLVTKTRQRVSA